MSKRKITTVKEILTNLGTADVTLQDRGGMRKLSAQVATLLKVAPKGCLSQPGCFDSNGGHGIVFIG